MPKNSFDIIGKIAVLQIRELQKKNEKKTADKILKSNKNIKSVYGKYKITGRLRLPKLKWLAGTKDTETMHKESGCLMKIDVKTCYFSPRLSNDRIEMAKKVKKNEIVLVMFSGIAPYALVIAKLSKAKKIYCIELSREASKYARENVRLNKFKNIEVLQGDVKRIVPKLAKNKIKFDRIIMARAQLKYDFLKEAFLAAKSGTIIHFYDFLKDEEFPKKAVEKINEAAKKSGRKIKIIGWKKVREIAPYKYHVRIDFRIKR